MVAAARQENAPLLIFDGDCGFCTTAVDWLARILPAMPPATPYQWIELEPIGLTESDGAAMVWLVTDERQYGGATAVAALLRHQPSPALRFLGWLGTVPPWSLAADLAYRLVARSRYRLPGGTPACRLPGLR
jgi:predicted DCC family thiol-disulfide oxidoreductase YuxK